MRSERPPFRRRKVRVSVLVGTVPPGTLTRAVAEFLFDEITAGNQEDLGNPGGVRFKISCPGT